MSFNKRYVVPGYQPPKRKFVKKEHLKDIDFRTREQRQATSTDTFIEWYEELQTRLENNYDERIAGQLEILSAVLWHILPLSDYANLRKIQNNKLFDL